jgi:hypothetical protein
MPEPLPLVPGARGVNSKLEVSDPKLEGQTRSSRCRTWSSGHQTSRSSHHGSHAGRRSRAAFEQREQRIDSVDERVVIAALATAEHGGVRRVEIGAVESSRKWPLGGQHW